VLTAADSGVFDAVTLADVRGALVLSEGSSVDVVAGTKPRRVDIKPQPPNKDATRNSEMTRVIIFVSFFMGIPSSY
jgi:hypothetical protein